MSRKTSGNLAHEERTKLTYYETVNNEDNHKVQN